LRLANREHGVAVLVGNGFTHELVCRAGVKLKVTCDGGDIGTGLLQGFAAVLRFELGQLFGVIEHGI